MNIPVREPPVRILRAIITGKYVKAIYEKGYSGSTSNAFEHLCIIKNGLRRDIEAVAYNFSNGFVDGINSRLKMIKRTTRGKIDIYWEWGKRIIAEEPDAP